MACVSFGCGANDGAGKTANSGLESGRNDAPLLCEGAGWNASKVVAAGFSGNDLVLVHADGSRHTAHSFSVTVGGTPGSARKELRTDDGAFTATAEPGGALVGESVRVRNDGAVVWRLSGIAEVASDAGMGARVKGFPRIVRADGTVSEVPVPGWDSFEFLGAPDAHGWMDARWTVFSNDQNTEHTGRVNLDGVRFEETRRVAPRVAGQESAEWALEEQDYVPTWLVHRPTNTRTRVRLDLLAPLRPLSGLYCNSATLLDDGRIGLGLRDDETAAFYVGKADGTGWERIGDAVRDVTAITGQNVGDAWVLTASSGRNTYCPPFEPFASNSEGVVAGDSRQLVAPGIDPMIFGGQTQWSLDSITVDPTGTCSFRREYDTAGRTHIIDLTTGESAETPALDGFTWL